MRFKFLFTLLLVALNGYAYQVNDSIQFEGLLKKAALDPDKAFRHYQEAKAFTKTPLQELRLNRLIAEAYFDLGQYDSAKLVLNDNSTSALDTSASTLNLELARKSVLLGKVLLELREYEASRKELQRAIGRLENKYKDTKELHAAYFYIGKGHRQMYELEEAEYWIKKALDHALEGDFKEESHKSYAEMGLIYHHQYRPSLAREYLTLGLLILDQHEIDDENTYRLFAHNNIAMTFDNEKIFDSAIYHYDRALFMTGKVKLNDYTRALYQGAILNNIASVYYGKEDHLPAISYAKKSLNIYEAYFGNNHLKLTNPLRNLGEALRDAGDSEGANIHLIRALDISKNNMDVFGNIRTYNALALSYIHLSEFQVAKQYCDSAMISNTYFLNEKREHYDYSDLFYSGFIYSIAVSLEPYPELSAVDSVYHGLKSSINYVHNQFQHPQTSGVIPSSLENLYRAYSKIYRSSKDEVCLLRMWEITELNKAINLRNQLKNEYSLTYAIPEELRLREIELKDSIDLILSSLEPNTFDSTLFFLKRKHDDLVIRMEVEYPKYVELKRKPINASYHEKQALLRQNEAHLAFLEGEDSIYLITLYPDRLINLSVRKDSIISLIEGLNGSLIQNRKDQISDISRLIISIFQLDELSNHGIDHLTLVPDGIIWKLNFAALSFYLEGNSTYLGNELTLAYHYYSSPNELESSKHPRSSVLAFSYNEVNEEPVENNYVAFRNLDASLPGTSEEVVAISEQWSGDYYFAGAANESTFKEKSKDYSILHLAVHGYMDEYYPENSFLKFASSDSANDGKLHAYELYNLELDADLAVITACHSGEGKIESGEGMMSIGRAFAYAGVESLLASRWEVPDVSAPQLMKYFYEGLKEGMRKSEALQFAQKKYLAEDADHITSAPLYWAGFYVIGDDSPIESKSKNLFLIITLFLISSVLLFVLVKRLQSKSPRIS